MRDKGTSFHLIVTQIKSARPVTKVGSEVPSKTNIELSLSGHLFLKRAAITPKLIPTMSQRMRAPSAKLTVTGRASRNRSVTQAFSLKEYPKDGAGHSKAADPVPYERPKKIPLRKSAY